MTIRSTSLVFASCLLALSACAGTEKPTAPMPEACKKYTDAKEKQQCVSSHNVAQDQCKREEVAYKKAKKDDKKKFNMEACVNKKVDAAMKKAKGKPEMKK